MLASLGLKKAGDNMVAAELVGCATKMPLAEFVPQLLRKMNRRRSIEGRKRNLGVELADLLHRSTQECKLILAPCAFSPKEIFERILLQVKVSEGVLSSPFVPVTKRFVGMHLSTCEREILRRLQSRNQIYWVDDSTSSRINSLVEYPLTTAVLVLKLPGSNLEIELKRAGRRERPLQVLFEKNGYAVPIPHRLHGAGTGWMLKSEFENESRFCSLFRDIHQHEPPLGRTSFITNIRGIPGKTGTADLTHLVYGRGDFRQGFAEMRLALKRCLHSFGSPLPEGPLAQTVAFLRHSQPRQSVLVGHQFISVRPAQRLSFTTWRQTLLRRWTGSQVDAHRSSPICR